MNDGLPLKVTDTPRHHKHSSSSGSLSEVSIIQNVHFPALCVGGYAFPSSRILQYTTTPPMSLLAFHVAAALQPSPLTGPVQPVWRQRGSPSLLCCTPNLGFFPTSRPY